MTAPKLPGPHPLALMMIAAALMATISVTGPAPTPYRLLKDFQPLYRRARRAGGRNAHLSRRHFDREIAHAGLRDKKLGQFLRLQMKIRSLAWKAKYNREAIADIERNGNPYRHYAWTSFKLPEFDELDEA